MDSDSFFVQLLLKSSTPNTPTLIQYLKQKKANPQWIGFII